jgi:osmotically-inducible protein OsmY
MRNRNFIYALVVGGLALTTTNLTAQGTEEPLPVKSQSQATTAQQGQLSKEGNLTRASYATCLKTSSLIGTAVRDQSGERLGKVNDLVVNLSSQAAPFAIIEYGGALGIGVTRVAVPLTEFKWSSEPKQLTFAGTKEQFQSASVAPTGGWTAVAGEDWAKNIDRFYGQPVTEQPRFERQEATGMEEGREAVRTPAEHSKGATRLLNQLPGATPGINNTVSTDEYVNEKVNSVVRQNMGDRAENIQITIKNGRVTLKGKAASQEQKQAIENQIKAVPGVDQVDNRLMVPEN